MDEPRQSNRSFNRAQYLTKNVKEPQRSRQSPVKEPRIRPIDTNNQNQKEEFLTFDHFVYQNEEGFKPKQPDQLKQVNSRFSQSKSPRPNQTNKFDNNKYDYPLMSKREVISNNRKPLNDLKGAKQSQCIIKLRRLFMIHYRNIRQQYFEEIMSCLKASGEYNLEQKNQIMQSFLNLCAIMIQKHWRAYRERTYRIPYLVKRKKQQRLLNAVVKGWKIRKILSGCQEIIDIKKELKSLENKNIKFYGPRDPKIYQIMKQRKQNIVELIRIIPRLYRRGIWLQSYNRKHSSKSQGVKIDFPSYQAKNSIQINFGNNLQNHYSSPQIVIEEDTNKGKQGHSYHQSYSMNNVDLGGNSQGRMGMDSFQYTPSQNSGGKQLEQKSSVMWPSKTSPISPEIPGDEMYTSRTGVNEKLGYLENNKGQIKKPNFSNFEFGNQHSNKKKGSPHKPNIHKQFEEDERPIQAHLIQSQYSYIEQKSQSMHQYYFNEEEDYTSQPLKQNHFKEEDHKVKSLNQNFYEEEDRPIQPMQQNYLDEDERPIQPMRQNQFDEDERPIKPLKSQTNFENSNQADQTFEEKPLPTMKINIIQDQENQNQAMQEYHTKQKFDDKAFKAMKRSPQFEDECITQSEDDERKERTRPQSFFENSNKESNVENEMIQPVGYNFEEMIEKALQGQGGGSLPPVPPQKSSKSKKGAKTGKENEEQEVSPEKKKEMSQKKNNLNKRQKYDPRKAIEQAKNKTGEVNKQHKSAFPEGMLNKKGDSDTKRSHTARPKNEDQEEEQEKVEEYGKKSDRIKKSRSQMRKMESEPIKEQEVQIENEDYGNQNIDSSNKPPKQFLKRKSKAVKFQKLDWKVNSRIDCWGNRDKSNTNSVTRKKTQPGRGTSQNQDKEEKKESFQINKIKVPPAQDEPIQIKKVQQPKPIQVKTIQLADLQPQKQMKMVEQPIDDHCEVESIPDENEEMFEEGQATMNNYLEQVPQLNIVSQQMMGFDQIMNEGNIYGEQQTSGSEQATLQLEELEKVFQVFHPKVQTFKDCQIMERAGVTSIPHMTMKSLFFSCYSDEIYDTILEDLREHYINLCNE